jgi:hypothetical protein
MNEYNYILPILGTDKEDAGINSEIVCENIIITSKTVTSLKNILYDSIFIYFYIKFIYYYQDLSFHHNLVAN